jgi:hypothetical protein
MDSFTQQHLAAWAVRDLHEDERAEVVGRMLALVSECPDLIAEVGGRSWPEIRDLAERNARQGIKAGVKARLAGRS